MAAALTLPAAASSGALADGSTAVPVTYGDTITRPGEYTLSGDCTGAGIAIQADNVTLDLGLNTLRRGGDFSKAATGIRIGPVANAVVANGTIEGFEEGVLLERSRAARVESIRVVYSADGVAGEMDNALIQDNTIAFSYFGIRVTGNDNVIRNNVVSISRDGIMLMPEHDHGSNGNLVEGNRTTGSDAAGIFLGPAYLSRARLVPPRTTRCGTTSSTPGGVGISLRSGTSFNRIEANRANDNKVAGVSVDPDARDNVLTRNVARGNGQADLVDYNPTCLSEWTGNEYGTFVQTCDP